MASIRVSDHFTLDEFIPKEIYDIFQRNGRWFIRREIVNLAEFIRNWFEAPMTINDWFRGGKFNERGYRVPESKTGSSRSQHKVCNAIDFNIKGLTPNQVRAQILHNQKEFLKAGLTTLEHESYAPTWIHADGRINDLNTILIVKPAVTLEEFPGKEEDRDEYFKFIDGQYIPIHF